jgi:alpha-L-rhamnosidase
VEKILGIINPLSQEIYHKIYNRFFSLFYDKKNEKCTVDTQTAVSMMICIKNDGISEGLIRQLTELVLKKDNHLDCGMVGLQYLIPALDMIGRNDLVYKIITATGYPSYSLWMEDGATTLYEAWNMKQSANHHMNSSAVSWFMKKLLGLSQKSDSVGYKNLILCPYFPDDMTYCEGDLRGIAKGKWERKGDVIHYSLTKSKDVNIEVVSPNGYYFEGSKNQEKYDLIFFKK